jgi:hypothetical protein
MTDQQQHPITPPPDLKEQWRELALRDCQDEAVCDHWMMNRAAQWGADQELEACIAWFDRHIPGYELVADRLREARRPKPPSLKEQAWKLLECYGTSGVKLTADQCNTIREALEELSND